MMIPAIAPDIGVARSHSEKRLSILDAAACVFCREGFGGANIDMVAATAGVSRQTIYNHHGDKEKLFLAVVREMTERINAEIFETIDTFPDKPKDLQADLTAFAVRIMRNCVCSRDGKFMRKLVQSEGERCPELIVIWQKDGPVRTWAALAARLARLALAGHLALPDPDLAARQFLSLVRADLEMKMTFGLPISDGELEEAASGGVTTFLRAFGGNAARRLKPLPIT